MPIKPHCGPQRKTSVVLRVQTLPISSFAIRGRGVASTRGLHHVAQANTGSRLTWREDMAFRGSRSRSIFSQTGNRVNCFQWRRCERQRKWLKALVSGVAYTDPRKAGEQAIIFVMSARSNFLGILWSPGGQRPSWRTCEAMAAARCSERVVESRLGA